MSTNTTKKFQDKPHNRMVLIERKKIKNQHGGVRYKNKYAIISTTIQDVDAEEERRSKRITARHRAHQERATMNSSYVSRKKERLTKKF